MADDRGGGEAGVINIPGERPARCLEEVLARMEGLGAVDGECEAVRGIVGIFPGTGFAGMGTRELLDALLVSRPGVVAFCAT